MRAKSKPALCRYVLCTYLLWGKHWDIDRSASGGVRGQAHVPALQAKHAFGHYPAQRGAKERAFRGVMELFYPTGPRSGRPMREQAR